MKKVQLPVPASAASWAADKPAREAVDAWDEDRLSYRRTSQLCPRFQHDHVLQPWHGEAVFNFSKVPQDEVVLAPAELPELRLRPRALTRAIGNLIDNATKYGSGEIAVSASQQANEIWIEVRDQGGGIPAAEAERLKRPFTRLDTARSNATGTGLGLAIVDRIARLHDGRLELLPNPGGGLLARLVIDCRT